MASEIESQSMVQTAVASTLVAVTIFGVRSLRFQPRCWTRNIPNLTRRAVESSYNVGRGRVIKLQPTGSADCLYNLHQDDNNRLNPDGTG